MSNALEKIYIGTVTREWYTEPDFAGDTEYIHADLFALMKEPLLITINNLMQENEKMREALEYTSGLADFYVQCKPGQCCDCDLLREISMKAQAALEEVNDE